VATGVLHQPPLVLICVLITRAHVPESRDETAERHVDVLGGSLLALGLGGVVYALIEGPADGWPPVTMVAMVAGIVALVAFVVVERRIRQPMIPLQVFRSRQFSGANAVTFCVYAALSAVFFLLTVHLQTDLGYSALEAGAASIPTTLIMLVFSARAGALAQRIGPRLPMTVGPLVVAAAMLLFTRVEPGVSYWSGVFPATVVLGAGLALTVAPLTATVLAAIDDHHAGIGSAINNAVARIAGLLSIAVLPAAAGIAAEGGTLDLVGGFGTAMEISAVLAAVGGLLAFLTVRTATPVREVRQSVASPPCLDPCLRERDEERPAA
jgi:hypothetical protein